MVILCEKPGVAKEFAKTLGCTARKGYYEGGGTIITYCVGHLFELYNPDQYDEKYKRWRLADLPVIPEEFRYRMTEGSSGQAQCVLTIVRNHKTDEIIIATDAGREGELIGRIVLKEAGITDISRCRRFWVSEALTEEVIKEGLAQAKRLSAYDMISRQGYARQHADWIVGINLTRFMSIGNRALFSVGRVQTAIMGAVAARNYQVANFIPTPYYELEIEVEDERHTKIKALLVNPDTRKTAFSADTGYILEVKRRAEAGPALSIASEKRERRRKPEKLMNITALQKAAYKRYGYTPEETLETAQALYEKYKCLSYPRTPSRVMGDNNVDLFREKYHLLRERYKELSAHTDPALINGNNRHIFNTAQLEDHHGLIPLNLLPEEATAAERNIYSMVVTAFFTVSMPDFIYNETCLAIKMGPYLFWSSYREVVQEGWRGSEKNEEGDGVREIREFDEKHCRVQTANIVKKKTEPKKEYSIDTLLALMENPRDEVSNRKLAGLGTPATRAEIIKTLFERGYLEEEKKKLFITKKGLFIINHFKKDENLRGILNIGQTTEWEEQLNLEPEEFEKNIIRFIREGIKKGAHEIYQEETLGICPRCGKGIVEGKKWYYCNSWNSEKKCDFKIWKTVAGGIITAEDVRLLLNQKQTGIKKCESKGGKKFEAAFRLDGENNITFIFKKRAGKFKGKKTKAK